MDNREFGASAVPGWTPRETVRQATPVAYVVCATERTGSTLLVDTLRRSGHAGVPREYFQPANRPRMARLWDAPDFPSYLKAVRQHTTGDNNVFGFKIHWSNLDDFVADLRRAYNLPDASTRQVLEAAFPGLQYVWMRRRDRLRQAMSLYRAEHNDVWQLFHRDKPARQQQARSAPPFDRAAIDACLKRINDHERAWKELFTREGIAPYVVWYEDFVQDPEQSTTRLMRLLGIGLPGHIDWPPTDLRKQSDTVTEEWIELYHASRTSVEGQA